jgi:hypothetical protein
VIFELILRVSPAARKSKVDRLAEAHDPGQAHAVIHGESLGVEHSPDL